MKVIDPDKTYIDYFQGAWCSQEGLANRFGVRVREGLFLAVVKIGDGQVNACGKEFRIPLQPEELPTHVRIIIYDHMFNYPASELMDLVTGKISFQQALALLYYNSVLYATPSQNRQNRQNRRGPVP